MKEEDAMPNAVPSTPPRRTGATASSDGHAQGTPTPERKRRDADARRTALLAKISECEQRGAISASDAMTLRNQVFDSTSGQWKAVQVRLNELMLSWNPYQDWSADERTRSTANATSPTSQPRSPRTPRGATSAPKQDFYELLQIKYRANVTAADIKRQFRQLALLLHPDKQQQQRATSNDAAAADEQQDVPVMPDSTQFARLRLAYETLSDPARRAAYDAQLANQQHPGAADPLVHGVAVGTQATLEASTDFASLEWMARVKHKMDVMDRIAEWATILGIHAPDLRFETGEACRGLACGKIVTMDRDLECYGSPRRRVYVCLLHKYIHACDALCTSHDGDAERDRKVCAMRAYWLVQNWIFDQLNPTSTATTTPPTNNEAGQEESKSEDASTVEIKAESPSAPLAAPCELVAAEIHLGDHRTQFSLARAEECQRSTCSQRFQFLEEGIYVCRRHGTAHVCTYEQCNRTHLQHGRFVCWVSGHIYGRKSEDVGTGTRTRRVLYTNSHGDESTIEMEVPVLLPLGSTTAYLLDNAKPHNSDVSSLSPPHPQTKTSSESTKLKRSQSLADDELDPPENVVPRSKRIKLEQQRMSSHRARLSAQLEQHEATSYYVYVRVPSIVASLPRVALELQDQRVGEDGSGASETKGLLPVLVRAKDTVNLLKYWLEELTEQQLSIWDQQLYWGDTLVGEEEHAMTLAEHGIHAGCILELRLHDDCPLQMADWTGNRTAGASLPTEYNTVQISKEAEEDLEDLQEEWENVGKIEEQAFQQRRLEHKRTKLERTGALHHVEVLKLENGAVPQLVDVLPQHRQQLADAAARDRRPAKQLLKVELDAAVDRETAALRSVAANAQPVGSSRTRPTEKSSASSTNK
ncbi:TPA: hypothetical protein N0F65_005395 [Lagenidium giganteum]|uniref:J domain-containing protein n=1 Tax=Lagenidium giganteum TaxID=4803 RepID=A0AAV2Z1Q9_9STRA|nr:TPA: hypothetical protein N0F65_005395 [Lagenidium giganteum]